jgi:hypothetical protein
MKVRSQAFPSGRTIGVPSAARQGHNAPSQVACRDPLAKLQVPVTRQPPSARTAFAPGPWPHATTSRAPPQISRATSGATYAEAIEHPDPWFMHHAADASPSAIASTHWM